MQNDLKRQTARLNIYALISRILMKEVDEALLKSIEEDEMILSFFPNFKEWELRNEMDRKDIVERYLNVDFTNLFLLHLVPYASFYNREDQMLETGGENPVIAFYNEYDFRVELDRARSVAADHIGIEMEFMYKLCESEYQALENDDKAAACEIAKIERDFLNKHILPWAPMYLIRVKEQAGTPFYYDAADLALEFILSDNEYLNTCITDNGSVYKV